MTRSWIYNYIHFFCVLITIEKIVLHFPWINYSAAHERHKHKQRKQSMTSPLGLNFSLFRLLFCCLLMLGIWSYAYAYHDHYVAGLTSFFCFAFYLCSCYCVNHALRLVFIILLLHKTLYLNIWSHIGLWQDVGGG